MSGYGAYFTYVVVVDTSANVVVLCNLLHCSL